MTTITYAGLGTSADLLGTDLIATWRSTGPLKTVTGAVAKAYFGADYLTLAGGTMTGALVSYVGSESLPGLTFAGDTDTGFYRIGANNIGVAVGGIKVADFSSTGMTGNASTATAWATARAMTGDVTATAFDGTAAIATTLATVNSNVGSFTNASITVNAKGLITAASTGAATLAYSSVNSKAATYTLVLDDAGAAFYLSSTGQIVVPSNASVAFPVGTTIRVYNTSATPGSGGEGTVSVSTDTLSWFTGSAVTSGSHRQLAVGGWCDLVKRTSTTWYMTGQGIT